MISEFEDADTQVLGISCDSKYSHKAWASHLGGISFPLLSDFWPHGQTGDKFGVFQPDGANIRASFMVDKDGVIRHIYTGPRGVQRSPEQAREALRSVAAVTVTG